MVQIRPEGAGAHIKQHALNQWSPAEGKGKGQKLLAQGNALGIVAISKSPCKGNSFVYCLVLWSFCPYRATGLCPQLPRALPWAKSFCPFRACCFYELLSFTYAFGRWPLVQGVLLLWTFALYLCFTLRPAIFNSATRRWPLAQGVLGNFNRIGHIIFG